MIIGVFPLLLNSSFPIIKASIAFHSADFEFPHHVFAGRKCSFQNLSKRLNLTASVPTSQKVVWASAMLKTGLKGMPTWTLFWLWGILLINPAYFVITWPYQRSREDGSGWPWVTFWFWADSGSLCLSRETMKTACLLSDHILHEARNGLLIPMHNWASLHSLINCWTIKKYNQLIRATEGYFGCN